jgi:hypothetical protein
VILASHAAYEKSCKNPNPKPLQKWEEEGHAVIAIAFDTGCGCGDEKCTAWASWS